MSEPEVAYHCSKESFRPAGDHRVRWLDPCADDQLFVQFCIARGEKAAPSDLRIRATEGFTSAGVIDRGQIVARASLWACAPDAWELAAVATLEPRRREGLGRSTCSFVTEAILEAERTATCHTAAGNLPMRRLAESLGYERLA